MNPVKKQEEGRRRERETSAVLGLYPWADPITSGPNICDLIRVLEKFCIWILKGSQSGPLTSDVYLILPSTSLYFSNKRW